MSVMFCEGFDWVAAVTDLRLRWGVETTTNLSIVTGRAGGSSKAVRFGTSAVAADMLVRSTGLMSRVQGKYFMLGFAFNISALPTGASCRICETTGSNGVEGFMIAVNETGFIQYIADDDITPFVGQDSSQSIDRVVPGAWHYIEFYMDVDESGNDAELRMIMDGREQFSFTDSITVEADAFAMIEFGKTLTGFTLDIDDIYWGDPQDGIGLADMPGDCAVETLIPDADGATNAWSFSGGASRWESVDEGLGVAHDGNTSYVSSTTAGQVQLFTFPDLAADATHGDALHVQASYVASKEVNAGGAGAKPLIRQNSVTKMINVGIGGGQDDYTMVQEPQATNPDGDAAWTVATVNSMEIGMETE